MDYAVGTCLLPKENAKASRGKGSRAWSSFIRLDFSNDKTPGDQAAKGVPGSVGGCHGSCGCSSAFSLATKSGKSIGLVQ